MSGLSFGEVGEILHLIESMNCRYLTLEYGDLRLEVQRGPQAGVPGRGEEASAPGPDQMEGGARAATLDGAPVAAPDDTSAATPEGNSPRKGETGEPSTGSAATGRQVAVSAPMAGTFYSRPAPGEPPFAAPGDHVEAGQTVGLVEVMKLFTELKTETRGIVARICAEDGELVEYEQPLVWIDPS